GLPRSLLWAPAGGARREERTVRPARPPRSSPAAESWFVSRSRPLEQAEHVSHSPPEGIVRKPAEVPQQAVESLQPRAAFAVAVEVEDQLFRGRPRIAAVHVHTAEGEELVPVGEARFDVAELRLAGGVKLPERQDLPTDPERPVLGKERLSGPA